MSDLFISCACVCLCECLFEMNTFVIVGHESNMKCLSPLPAETILSLNHKIHCHCLINCLDVLFSKLNYQ